MTDDTPSPTPEPSLDADALEVAARADYEAGIRYFGFDDELSYPERPMALARVTARAAITAYLSASGILTALTEEREAHQRTRDERDQLRECAECSETCNYTARADSALRDAQDQLAAAEAALQAREREVERLVERWRERGRLLSAGADRRREDDATAYGMGTAAAAFIECADALAPPTPQTPKEDG